MAATATNTVGFIFARGGSKGLVGKNLRPLAGKPLIGWAIEQALAVRRIRRVIVSTDSEEIAAVARGYGAETPFVRPAHLARDDSPEWLAWRHALEHVRDAEGALPDVMVSVPATSPLRLPIDVEKCLDEYAKGEADIVITVTDAHRNPHFNMVQANKDGTVSPIFPSSLGVTRRQDAPAVYDVVTVAYVANPGFVLSHQSAFEGRVRAVHVPVERSIDIDTLLDFEIAEMLVAKRSRRNDNA